MQVGKLLHKLSDYQLVKRTLFRGVSYPSEKKKFQNILGIENYCCVSLHKHICEWLGGTQTMQFALWFTNEERLATSDILCQFGTNQTNQRFL